MVRTLPGTRSLRRHRPIRLWWLAVAVALAVNLGVVLVLGQISRLHHETPPPPLAVRSLRQTPPTTPPQPPDAPHPQPDLRPAEMVPVALPMLDLPTIPAPRALELPAVGSLDASLALPLAVPAFVPVGPPTELPPNAQTGPFAVDTPAQRQGAFDLDRFYPRTARQRGITGSTRVRLAIDASGTVTAVTVLESTPPGVFEQAAERLARSLHYLPATIAGQSVPSTQEAVIAWTIR